MGNHKWIWMLNIPACLSAVFVVVAHPSQYGYYTLSRLLVTGAAAATAYLIFERKPAFGLVLAGIAILFNPIVKFSLGRELWVIADVIAVACLVIGGGFASVGQAED